MIQNLGGPVGQRERIYMLMWAMAMLSGIATHYSVGMPADALTLLLGCGAALVGSYTYRPSATAGAPTKPGSGPVAAPVPAAPDAPTPAPGPVQG